MLPQVEKLTAVLGEIGAKHNISVAQVAIAWAIAKGTIPIIGVTKVDQVQDVVQVAEVNLTEDEMNRLETAAKQTGVDTRGSWENPMA